LLGEPDLPAVVDLARDCLSADGGQPFAASPGFLGRCYLSGAETYAGFSGTQLVCVSSLRRPAAALYRRLGFTRIGRRARYQAGAVEP
jgi:hypothetical protein